MKIENVDGPLLEVKGLSKYYTAESNKILNKRKYIKVVDHIDLSIYPGEVFGLVGESGCGKSTFAKMLVDVITPTEGQIAYKGKNYSEMSHQQKKEYHKDIQIIFQDPYSSLNPKKRVGWILEEPLKIHTALTSQERKQKVEEILEVAGLDASFKGKFPNELSGGQRQRVSVAAALMLNPELIIADESVSALDVSIQSQILNLMKKLQEEKNLTYLFISHDLNVVQYMSDRIGVMYFGKLVEVGSVDDIYQSPRHPYTKALLSSIPSVSGEMERERILLTGDVPDLLAPPGGCPFHTRCREMKESCKRECPELVEIEKGHFVSCNCVQALRETYT